MCGSNTQLLWPIRVEVLNQFDQEVFTSPESLFHGERAG